MTRVTLPRRRSKNAGRATIPCALGALLLALAWVPSAAAQEHNHGQNPSGDVAGRPEFAADAADCRDHAAWTPAVACTVLYGHLFNLLDAVPMNVQYPSGDCRDLARGFTTFPTVEPLFAQNQMSLYSSPGFVEYEHGTVRDGRCEPYLHPERGLGGDVLLSRKVPLVAYWYLSADTDEVSLLADPDALDTGAMPCVTVRVTLQTGRTFGQGTLLARGEATRTVLSTKAADSTLLPAADPCARGALVAARHPNLEVAPVHEFPVALDLATGDIPSDEGFVVHVQWWQGDAPTGNRVAQREWNVHSGDAYRSRLVVPVLNPASVESLRPQLFRDVLYLRASFMSPWGSYDVDPGSLEVSILRPDGAPLEDPAFGEPILVYDISHEGHFRPVNLTVPWAYREDALAPGTYTVRVAARNWQHSVEVMREATVTLPENHEERPALIRAVSSDGIVQRNVVERGSPTATSGGDEHDDEDGGLLRNLPAGGVGGAALALGLLAVAGRRRLPNR